MINPFQVSNQLQSATLWSDCSLHSIIQIQIIVTNVILTPWFSIPTRFSTWLVVPIHVSTIMDLVSKEWGRGLRDLTISYWVKSAGCPKFPDYSRFSRFLIPGVSLEYDGNLEPLHHTCSNRIEILSHIWLNGRELIWWNVFWSYLQPNCPWKFRICNKEHNRAFKYVLI